MISTDPWQARRDVDKLRANDDPHGAAKYEERYFRLTGRSVPETPVTHLVHGHEGSEELFLVMT